MGPADPAVVAASVDGSSLKPKYAAAVDRESAREKLAAKLEAGAEAAKQEQAAAKQAGAPDEERIGYPKGTVRRPTKKDASVVQDIMNSPAARDLMRTAAREIVRGVFGVGRRR
jgi:hypothetical protein